MEALNPNSKVFQIKTKQNKIGRWSSLGGEF
jgi:hypothetical protein